MRIWFTRNLIYVTIVPMGLIYRVFGWHKVLLHLEYCSAGDIHCEGFCLHWLNKLFDLFGGWLKVSAVYWNYWLEEAWVTKLVLTELVVACLGLMVAVRSVCSRVCPPRVDVH